MHEIDQKLKRLIFFLNFDLVKVRGLSPWLRPWPMATPRGDLRLLSFVCQKNTIFKVKSYSCSLLWRVEACSTITLLYFFEFSL